jgi:thymidylate synthase (FAD)
MWCCAYSYYGLLKTKFKNIMKVNLKAVTPNAEETIVEIARVSSRRKDKKSEPEGLINYLIKNWHWSPFEHGFITMEIETSKAIGIQLIRHRSFTFQEFSQRYQDVSTLSEEGMFEEVEIRKQAVDNRQSSEEVFDPEITVGSIFSDDMDKPLEGKTLKMRARELIDQQLEDLGDLYTSLLEAGVAREQARMVLPLATKTRIYMTGSIRSWIHFIKLRDDGHAQKEAQEVARAVKDILKVELPIISKALGW